MKAGKRLKGSLERQNDRMNQEKKWKGRKVGIEGVYKRRTRDEKN